MTTFRDVYPDVSKERSTLIAKGSAIVREDPNRQKPLSGNVNLAKLLVAKIFFRNNFENIRM